MTDITTPDLEEPEQLAVAPLDRAWMIDRIQEAGGLSGFPPEFCADLAEIIIYQMEEAPTPADGALVAVACILDLVMTRQVKEAAA